MGGDDHQPPATDPDRSSIGDGLYNLHKALVGSVWGSAPPAINAITLWLCKPVFVSP